MGIKEGQEEWDNMLCGQGMINPPFPTAQQARDFFYGKKSWAYFPRIPRQELQKDERAMIAWDAIENAIHMLQDLWEDPSNRNSTREDFHIRLWAMLHYLQAHMADMLLSYKGE